MVVKLKESYVIKLGEKGKLYLKDVVDALYPSLSQDTINKVHHFGTGYEVKKFGFDVKNLYNGGQSDDPITWTGSLIKNCINIPPSSSKVESYSINDEAWNNRLCTKQFFNDDAYIQIVKAAKGYGNVDQNKPVVVISQKDPLTIDARYGYTRKVVTEEDSKEDIFVYPDSCTLF